MIASATRLSSPPEAIFASERARLAGVRREPEDDLVGPGGVERDRVAVELHRRLVLVRGPAPHVDGEGAGSEAEAPQRLVGRGSQPLGGGSPARRQLGRGERDLGEQPLVIGLAATALALEALQPLDLRLRSLSVREDRRLVLAVAALQGVDP